MSFIELFFVAVGLSADAFAVALADGLNMKQRRNAVVIAFMFGLFQAAMPIIGFFAGRGLARYISAADHIIALCVLGIIGGKMVIESVRELVSGQSPKTEFRELSFPLILAQSFATAIDALMVGIGFAAINVEIAPAAMFIGVVTFALSLIGALGGQKLGLKLGVKAELIGGAVLIIIGVKTFFEHVLA